MFFNFSSTGLNGNCRCFHQDRQRRPRPWASAAPPRDAKARAHTATRITTPPSPPQEDEIVLVDDEEDEAALLPFPTPAVVEAEAGAPLLMLLTEARVPNTPRVQVREGDALAFESAPTGASVFAFGSGVSGSTSAAVVDADAVAPRLLSPTAATAPSSPRTGPRRPAVTPAVEQPPRPRWHMEPALGLASSLSNGVASGTRLPGGSSDEKSLVARQ